MLMLAISFNSFNQTKPGVEIPVNDLVKLSPSKIQSFLKTQYGASAKITFDRENEEWTAETTNYKVGVSTYKGKILCVTVRLNSPTPVKDALKMMGLEMKQPTSTGTCGMVWDSVYPGFDSMNGIKPCFGGKATSQGFEHFCIKPNKAFYDSWAKGG